MLAAACGGNQDAFLSFVTPLAPRLRHVARRYVGCPADAEDICQESLLKAYLKLDQFSGGDGPVQHELSAWVTKIAANSAIDFVRRKQPQRFVAWEECPSALNATVRTGTTGWGENPEKALMRKERRALIVKAIAKLPVELRRVCVLRNVMELSTKEVATRLGITTTAVRLRLFRAHGQLRSRLGREAVESRVRWRQS